MKKARSGFLSIGILASFAGCPLADDRQVERVPPSLSSEVSSLIDQARQGQNRLVEIESGTGDGIRQDRGSASNKTTVLLHQGEARTINVNLVTAADAEVRFLFSNDGPGTTDQVEIKVNNQTRVLPLSDTREGYVAGQGWNNISVAGPAAPVVSLNAGDNLVTLTVTTADSFGVELDALLVFVIGASTEPPVQPGQLNVSTIPALLEAIRTAPAGATIRLPANTYVVTETIVIARDDITIEGEGDATFIRLADNARCPRMTRAASRPNSFRRNVAALWRRRFGPHDGMPALSHALQIAFW